MTYAGSLRLPRNGTGARYGASVSINRRSSGIVRAASRRSTDFGNVAIPGMETENPVPKARVAVTRAVAELYSQIPRRSAADVRR